jgi:hypothetical protein
MPGVERTVQFKHVALKPVLPFRRGDFHGVPKFRVPRCPQVNRRPRSADRAGERCDAKAGVGELDQLIAKRRVVVGWATPAPRASF